MVRFGHPKTNNLSNAQMAAETSPYVMEHRVSAGDVNRDLVNDYRELLGQHVGMWSNVRSQYFCKSKQPIPTLLKLVLRQACH